MVSDEVIAELYQSVKEQALYSKHVPIATYRIQLNHLIRFRDVTKLVPYLYELGVTDCYLSSYLKARKGSMHGYDITDHNEINPEIGSLQDFNWFVEQLEQYGMGHILDFVPNHMGIYDNSWWQDVLENGTSSPYAQFFDIDWNPVKSELHQKVLLPILEDLYGKVLESGLIHLSFDKGAFFINYRNHKLPIDPRTAVFILEPCSEHMENFLSEHHADCLELRSIITAYNNLPERSERKPDRIAERRREKDVVKRRLWDLHSKNNHIRRIIQAKVREINGKVGDTSSFDRLHELLQQQAYRLSYWRVAGEEINYRRFFDINELAALNMEENAVFELTHRMVMHLLASGRVNGLRVDHVDGLFSPADYLWRLQRQYLVDICLRKAKAKRLSSGGDEAVLKEALVKLFENDKANESSQENLKTLYLIVEKILGDRESLRKNWPVDGTTGYEYAAVLNGIFVDRKNEKSFLHVYRSFTGKDDSFKNIVYLRKSLVMRTSMAAEINVLAGQLNRISEQNRIYRDFTLNSLRDAIREVVACFPVYRTYINAYENYVSETDRNIIDRAVAIAKHQNPAISADVFNFLRNSLLEFSPDTNKSGLNEQRRFIMRFQQFTGPVMAKGMEDTAFYIYNPLISLNEVGNNPIRFGNSKDVFHRHNIQRHKNMPYSMINTSTHDSKRSEDVRARINILSEIPREWRNALWRWTRLNRDKRAVIDDETVPCANVEYYIYQSMLGTYPPEHVDTRTLPAYADRIRNHVLKAAREAKEHTSWISPNTSYEEALQTFIAQILKPGPDNKFLADFATFNQLIVNCGLYTSLSQVTLKLFSPGVPDIYRGNEVWMFNLTDPDNRRPVDYTRRVRLFKQIKSRLRELKNPVHLVGELLDTMEDGRIKLYVTWKSLNYRRRQIELFQRGSYIPLRAAGNKRQHACAFSWQYKDQKIIVVAPILLAGLTRKAEIRPLGDEAWEDTHLILPKESAGQTYQNIFTSEYITAELNGNIAALPLANALRHFPLAVLELTRG